ncbi:Lar family restriction alleviation protein [Pseudomonas aeruginosa]|uniref:Lar family restriction alleviation protein n=1 Tax=Pseudomonas aeruginosa TaxID=287 RepID=UPI001495C562|nr:Lar family restriction alleviation protein [Pseudomonas aeruginosa]HBO3869459.1 Lar family restriction alleviation protein [Pseudomonas aeruginosa]HCF6615919.1 Lar family restriction alleviation protein [Pseudomonas aeruginosa]HCL4190243.1 Lar family restriction alleviation protein [Pseudomonas aeruginosa]HCR1463630.1 Lar family restriction alleviation protein [Pseudomonas aeruginosa]HCR1470024.1 Lar family restriction alleviation protein [Pseudomonas aeruginosa]
MTELKPCPFCGGSAFVGPFTRKRWFCECEDCGTSMISQSDKQHAIDQWNRRAIPADHVLVPRELLEELLEAAKDGSAHKGEYLSKKYGEPELFAKFDTLLQS